MGGDEGLLHGQNLFLLTIKGQVTVHFLDGSTVVGEVLAQDTLNVFVLPDDGAPLMIPRHQIKYLKGQKGQPLEKDISPEVYDTPAPASPENSQVRPEEQLEAGDYGAGDDGADDHEEDVEEDGTVVLAPEVEAAAIASFDELENTGLTMVLDEELTSEDEAEEELDELTYIFNQEMAEGDQATARLICQSGPHQDEVFILTGGVMTLGRSTDNTFALNKDKEVSRRHAIVVQESDRFFIQDQNSLNGTFVNDELVKGSHYLQEGDIILLGLTTLEYRET